MVQKAIKVEKTSMGAEKNRGGERLKRPIYTSDWRRQPSWLKARLIRQRPRVLEWKGVVRVFARQLEKAHGLRQKHTHSWCHSVPEAAWPKVPQEGVKGERSLQKLPKELTRPSRGASEGWKDHPAGRVGETENAETSKKEQHTRANKNAEGKT